MMCPIAFVLAVGELSVDSRWSWAVLAGGTVLFLALVVLVGWLTTRYIPNKQVGIIEKLWSARGSVPV